MRAARGHVAERRKQPDALDVDLAESAAELRREFGSRWAHGGSDLEIIRDAAEFICYRKCSEIVTHQ